MLPGFFVSSTLLAVLTYLHDISEQFKKNQPCQCELLVREPCSLQSGMASFTINGVAVLLKLQSPCLLCNGLNYAFLKSSRLKCSRIVQFVLQHSSFQILSPCVSCFLSQLLLVSTCVYPFAIALSLSP